jgi:hypothetical protein
LRTIENKVLDPAGLVVRVPALDCIVGMVIRFFGSRKMRMNQRDRTAMIIPVMKMKERGRQQDNEHCAGTHTGSQPLHIVRFCCTLEGMSTNVNCATADFIAKFSPAHVM